LIRYLLHPCFRNALHVPISKTFKALVRHEAVIFTLQSECLLDRHLVDSEGMSKPAESTIQDKYAAKDNFLFLSKQDVDRHVDDALKNSSVVKSLVDALNKVRELMTSSLYFLKCT
jgi:hypothetical protein